MTLHRHLWTVETIESHAEAVGLIERAHYAKGAPNTSVYRHGLRGVRRRTYSGVALWLPPTKTAAASVAGEDWRGVLSLSRLVCLPYVPKNGASFLLGRSMRLIDRKRWPVLLTYADTTQGHTGAIYLATNWTSLGEVPAGDTWVGPNGEQRGRKRGAKNFTVSEMKAMGFKQKKNAPKIKFIHIG